MNGNTNKLKIIAETKTLVQSLALASSVVEKRNVISELANVKFLVKGNILELSSTNMDLYLTQKIVVQVISEGSLTVSTKTLNDIIKKIPDDEITLSNLENSELQVSGKNCHFNLHTLPAESFPDMDNIEPKVRFKISCSDLAKLIELTRFSISQDETRYNLNGIYLHVANNSLYAASTDGHRLSVSSVPLQGVVEEFGIIFPQKSADELLKVIKDPKNLNAEMEIFLNSNKIKLVCNRDIIMLSKLIDGVFPQYNEFIPSHSTSKIIINRKIFVDVIERIAVITVQKFRTIKLSISSTELEVSAVGEARGNARESVSSSSNAESFYEYDGPDTLVIGFNPQYLENVLRVIKDDLVELHFTDAHSSVLIKAQEESRDLFVVMPVKV